MTKLISLLAAVALLFSPPAMGQETFGGGYTYATPIPAEKIGPICTSSVTDLTTYTFSGVVLTGVSDSDTVAIFVGFASEDNAITFQHGAVTVDGVTMTETVDENGSGFVNTSFARGAQLFTNAASVDVVITATEAITGMVACVWAFKYITTFNQAGTPIADDDTASGALVLTLTTVAEYLTGMHQMGVCASANAADTATWGVLTEQVDTNNGEFSYSAADRMITQNESSSAVTCDYAGGDDASGAAMSAQR